SVTSFGYIGVGSGTNVVTDTDLDLQTVISPRTAAQDSYPVNNVAYISAFYASADNNGTWNELSLNTQLGTPDSTHPMIARKIITAFTKDTTKTAIVIWALTFVGV